MNELEKLIAERLSKIEASKADLALIAKSLQQLLYDVVVTNYDELIDKFSRFYTLYESFASTEFKPLIQEVVTTLSTIKTLNGDYFKAQQIDLLSSINSKVEARLFDTFGLTKSGAAIKGGYIDGLMLDQTVKNKVGNFLVREAIATRAKPIAIRELKYLIQGEDKVQGVYETFLNDGVYDRLQEADRITQVVYAEELSLQSAYYSGAIISGTRPFCKVRAGKVFTLDEIKKFGTAKDSFGGYEDKAVGLFAGKPGQGYNPLLQLGGYRCQHTFGFVTNKVALNNRSDLKEVNGKLVKL